MFDHNSSQFLDRFEELGLSRTEASVYLALLQNHPVTGYQLAKDSGILRPVVYEMLTRLVEKGGAKILKAQQVDLKKKSPEKYSPIKPEIFLMTLDKRFSEARSNLIDSLSNLENTESHDDDFWNLSDTNAILTNIINQIQKAKKNIFIYLNNPEYALYFKDALSKMSVSQISIIGFSYRALELPGVELYSYRSSIIDPKISDGQVMIVIDEQYSINAELKKGKACQSSNPIQVQSSLEFIKTQISLFRMGQVLPFENLSLYLFEDQRQFLQKLYE